MKPPSARLELACLSALLAAVLLLLAPAGAPGQSASEPARPSSADSQAIEQLPPVVVIDATPVPALGTPIEKYAGNVQTISPRDLIQNDNLLDIPDLLYKNFGSVNVNGSQGNPWQNDLTYRGFLASPLTGSPIGLSMYLDGMRFNDGFGDTINWDLIPQSAIADIDIIPGSNPIFGLNTLGGALSVHTKRGFDFPGVKLESWGGSFGRWSVNAEYGGFRGQIDWYLTFNSINDAGWREHSPSDLRQLFAKVGYRTSRTDIQAAFIYANNRLTGNGLAPESLLAVDRSAVYTFPDLTQNLMYMGNVRGRQWLTDDLLLSGNVFYRSYRRTTSNGDVQLDCHDDQSGAQAFFPNGQAVPPAVCNGSATGFVSQSGQPLTGHLSREATGEARTTKTDTQDWGTTLQLSYKGKLFGFGNQVTAGVAYDGHQSRFNQRDADADLVPDGNSRDVVPTSPFETAVSARTIQQNVGVYVTDTLDVTDWLSLTAGFRFQTVNIDIADQTGLNPSLDGHHTYQRISPAAGITVRPLPQLTLFGAYNQGFRAPTAAELTCADPNAPCSLPNAFVADPPLNPAVAYTYEFGARGTLPLGDTLGWNLAFFRTNVNDDILFTQTQSTGAGFFQNVARTRRQGVEVGLQGSAWKRVKYYLSYAYVDATYQTSTTLASVTSADGVAVRPGDRIPGIPPQNVKFGAQVAILDNLWVGSDVIFASGSVLRGDEGNHQPTTSPYTLLGFNVRYAPFKFLEIWGRVDNVTNAKYATGGALNWNAFADPISVQRFLAPGAPIAGWGGIKVRF